MGVFRDRKPSQLMDDIMALLMASLQAHSLLVAIYGTRLVDAEIFSCVPLTISMVTVPELGIFAASSNKYKLLAKYPKIIALEFPTSTVK